MNNAGGFLRAVAFWVWAIVLVLGLRAEAEEIAFDNTTGWLTNSFTPQVEAGDEVRLAGEARQVREFAIEYYGEFVPTGIERAQVRFYSNDGPDVDPRPDRVILGPGTVLYESGWLQLAPGSNALLLQGLDVTVPTRFTWTVQFEGVDGSVSNRASLVFFNPPAFGASFDDFWQRTANGWQLFRFGGQPVANFGCQVVTGPDSLLRLDPPTGQADGTIAIRLHGPVGRVAMVESSVDPESWFEARTVLLTNSPMTVTVGGGGSGALLSFRGSLLERGATRMVDPGWRGTEFSFSFFGPAGRGYRLERTFDLAAWELVRAGLMPVGAVRHVDGEGVGAMRLYRLLLDDPVQPRFDALAAAADRIVLQVELSGRPGGRVVIESSTDLASWSPVTTNRLSFSSGSMTLVDLEGLGRDRKFYRMIDQW